MWLFYVKNVTWIHKKIFDYLRSVHDIELIILPSDQKLTNETYHDIKNDNITKIIYCNYNIDNDQDFTFDFYYPIFFANICKKYETINFTYISYLYLFHSLSDILAFYDICHIQLGLIADDRYLDEKDNILHKLIHYQTESDNSDYLLISVFPEILPIMSEIVKDKNIYHCHLINPTQISVSQMYELYKEYFKSDCLSNTNNIVYTHHNNNNNISDISKDYFILPIYQSLQRLFKNIRKQKIINHSINLNQKCNILITGGYGFIGSNLIHYLYHKYPKSNIINIDRLDYCSRKENIEELIHSHRIVSYEIDLSDTSKVYDVLIKHDINYVFHLAAQSHVDNSFNNSLQFSKDNVFATHSLLEACKNYGKILRFLHVSTDEIYGETLQKNPFSESELPNPTNPYAATKVGAEFIVKSYFHCFELPILIIRGNNVYGPRQYPEKMIPKFITLLLNNEKCTIAGNGLMKRNFIYVDDMCSGLIHVLENGKIDSIYNIGCHEEKSVYDVAYTLSSIIKGNKTCPTDHIEFVKDRYYNDFRYSIDTHKINQLGWKPTISFQEGLAKTIQFYSENGFLYNNMSSDDV